jgi:membrane-bound metal-dependent hydrolase YbcI (DUF457 family)
MLFWYGAVSILLVAVVFRSVGVDYRLVAAGALAPLVLDAGFGHRAFAHTLAFAVLSLVVVMVATIGRSRLLRRRLLCLPIGVFTGLVLSGAFTDTRELWWPAFGTRFSTRGVLPSVPAIVVEEALGLFATWVLVGWYDLYLPGPRRSFLREGRLRPSTEP